MSATTATDRLTPLVADRERVLEAFLAAEQHRLARACHDMARAFHRGGTLVPFGAGAAATDAAHVAVEFMHPVIVGKRALPALAGPGGRAGDIALAIAHDGDDGPVRDFLAAAADSGMLTLALGAGPLEADHPFVVPSDDPAVVQEVQETAYHVLWELVHVFFEHPGLLASGSTAVADEAPDPTAFLYPFQRAAEVDLDGVLADVGASTVRKGQDTVALRRAIDLDAVARLATAVRDALASGGRLLAFGNGGSATDAMDLAFDVRALGFPAAALVDDVATITAVGNDVGFDNVFSRQLIPLGRRGDVALAITTSGSSANIVAGLEEAHRRGMVTCAITGYDGGRLAQLDWLDHLIVVPGDYIPRLQEAHATVYHLLVGRLR